MKCSAFLMASHRSLPPALTWPEMPSSLLHTWSTCEQLNGKMEEGAFNILFISHDKNPNIFSKYKAYTLFQTMSVAYLQVTQERRRHQAWRPDKTPSPPSPRGHSQKSLTPSHKRSLLLLPKPLTPSTPGQTRRFSLPAATIYTSSQTWIRKESLHV